MLKSLSDHDKEAQERYNRQFAPTLNGIACPECGIELKDDNNPLSQPLPLMPPRKPIFCQCGFRASRINC